MFEEEQARHKKEYFAFKENLNEPFGYIKEKLEEVASFSEIESEDNKLNIKFDDPEVILNIKLCNKKNNVLIIFKLESNEDIDEALPTFESTFKDAFDFFQLTYDSKQRDVNIEFYEEIHDLENEIRKNIMRETILLYGKDWFDKITECPTYPALNDVKNDAEENYEKDSREMLLEPIIYPKLYYFTLKGLRCIIDEKNNWNSIFADVYGDKNNLAFIKKIGDMRNKIMHNQYLSDKSKERLKQYIDDIMSILHKSNP